jgi:hypothetical protein
MKMRMNDFCTPPKTHVRTVASAATDDTGGILTAMLEEIEGIVHFD